VIAKSGAEGVFAAWAPEAGLSIVLKCEDGSKRAAEGALVCLLDHLGFQLPSLKGALTISRWGGEAVGKIFCR